MLEVNDLPLVNATLNALATMCLLTGYVLIRRGDRARHRLAMLAALVMSALFLTSYVIYHANAGSRPFDGTGPIRLVYFVILVTHVVLAIAIVPLVLVTVTRALRGRFEAHRRLARWTFPIWLYVSVTGVVVYVMLYRL
jgi:uncharacterized membrane protein YozB (DUF420 family)